MQQVTISSGDQEEQADPQTVSAVAIQWQAYSQPPMWHQPQHNQEAPDLQEQMNQQMQPQMQMQTAPHMYAGCVADQQLHPQMQPQIDRCERMSVFIGPLGVCMGDGWTHVLLVFVARKIR
jgi:hypothetical protein